MPPKKAKKSKKQLEEEKRIAEEERIALEAKEQKMREEEAERQRVLAEQRRLAEEKRRQEELERLAFEAPEEEKRFTEMAENAKFAEKARIKPLPDKYLKCDPLPDVDDERDLTSFITLWSEGKDLDLAQAIQNAQIAEDIVKSMQDIQGDALAMYNTERLQWCRNYTDQLREIQLKKFDEITSHILDYMEVHTRRSKDEIEKIAAEGRKGGKGDQTKKDFLEMVEKRDDLMFGVWANIQGKSRMGVLIEYGNYGTNLPMKQSSSQLVMRCLWTGYDYLTATKIQDDIVVGGVVNFQMYSFPESAKPANKWTMRNILTVEQRLKNVPFPDPTGAAGVEQPVDMQFTLPESIFTEEDASQVKIAVWDEEQQCWNHSFIGGDLQFKKSTRQIKFTTMKFAPMALLQSRCTDYPYKNWWLRCTDNDTALLTLWTKRIELVFEIGPLYLKLVRNEQPELQHLCDKEFTPGYLLQELSKCGIHLMPRDEDAKLAGIESKDRGAEERAIIDVALGVRAFHFRCCKWNQGVSPENTGVGADNILVRIRENLEFDEAYEEDYEPDWMYVQWWNNKVSFMTGCKESQEDNCKAEIMEGQETHATLKLASTGLCTEQATSTSGEVTYIEFTDTVKKTLRLLRLFAFS